MIEILTNRIYWFQGSRNNGVGDILGDDVEHNVANDKSPRMCPRSALWSLYWPRKACFWPKTRAMDCAPSAVDRASWMWYCIHGHRRQVLEEIRGDGLLPLQAAQADLLDPHIWLSPFLPVSAPRHQLCFRCFTCSSSHVTQVLITSLITYSFCLITDITWVLHMAHRSILITSINSLDLRK